MSERKGMIEALPPLVQYGLVIALLFAACAAFYFGQVLAVWAIIGPLLFFNFWTGQKFSKYERAENPKMFWCGVICSGLMTFVGAISLYELLAGLNL